MKISLGTYIPGNSVFHRADPRTKIIWTLAMLVLLLMAKTVWQYALAAFFVIVAVILTRVPLKMIMQSMKPVIALLVFTVIFNLLFYKGETVAVRFWIITVYREAIEMSLKTIIRVALLVTSASLLTYTTTSVSITDGLEALMRPLKVFRFPAHEFAMMMSIALRFIPIFADETDKIIKAQTARGARFDSANPFIKIKSYVPVLIPLFISAFKSAEDMATAMEARCYRGGEGRTRYKVLKFSGCDIIIAAGTAVFAGCLIILKVFGV